MSAALPATRDEACDWCMKHGFTIGNTLAVAAAFPLPGETERTAEFIERWRERDAGCCGYCLDAARKVLAIWQIAPPDWCAPVSP